MGLNTKNQKKNISGFSSMVGPGEYKTLAEKLLKTYNENETLFYKYMQEFEAALKGECTNLFDEL